MAANNVESGRLNSPQATGVDPEQVAAAVAEALPDPVVFLNATFRPVWANAAAEQIFGWDRSEYLGELDLLGLVHPDDMNEALNSITSIADKDVGTLIELRIQSADGVFHRTEIRGRATTIHGEPGLILTVRELDDRHGWDVARGNEDLLRTVVEAAATPVLICEEDGTVRSASAALGRTLGSDRELVIGTPLTALVAPQDRDAVDAALDSTTPRTRTVAALLLDTSGSARPFRLEISDLRDDPAVNGYVVFMHDVEDLTAALTDLKRVAETDALTGLLNRAALLEELRSRLACPSGNVAVAFCDVDGFKAVNDLFGHGYGDELLCEVADRLRSAVRTGDVVARLGGDEFVVVASASNPAAIENLVDRIERAVNRPSRDASNEAFVAVSVGAVLVEAGSCSAEEALAEADSDMYRTKAWRRGLEVRPDTVSVRRAIAAELLRGFGRGEIKAHFQAIVSLDDGTVHGFETLVRWEHPTRGLLGPNEFLAVCEEAGLQGRLAEVTIRGATELLANTPDHIGVSVNLSPLQLADPSITDALLSALAETGVSPPRLAVEVTERSVLDRLTPDGRRVPEVLADLQKTGIRVAVDDFGTGTASLSRLVEMPASVLKVDRSFVAGLGEDPVASALVRCVVALAEELGLGVVAEGVETVTQETALSEMGCMFAQGWLYSKAVPFDVAHAQAHRIGALTALTAVTAVAVA